MSEPNSERGIRSAEGQVFDSLPPQVGALALPRGEFTGSLNHHTSAKAVFLAWEKLRIAYNVLMALFVCIFFYIPLQVGWITTIHLIEGALIANLCFCVGPCAEGYLALIGLDRMVARVLLFIPGLLLTCVLAVGWLLLPLNFVD